MLNSQQMEKRSEVSEIINYYLVVPVSAQNLLVSKVEKYDDFLKNYLKY